MLNKLSSLARNVRRHTWHKRSAGRRVAFCTIATSDFLPGALALLDSVREAHPSAELCLLFIGATPSSAATPALDGVRVMTIGDLVASDAEVDLRLRYTTAEFCFALKPRLLRRLLDDGAERAIYLDSDICVYSPLEEVLIALEHSSAVLTPHLDAPIPDDGARPNDLTILRAGAHNLGFIAVASCDESREMLDWWALRVARWGYVAPDYGYQGDQKWMDLAPSLFPRVGVLRHGSYNAAYWNLHSRYVDKAEGRWTVNGLPLAFFHFSGLDLANPGELSKFQNRIRLAEHGGLSALVADYRQRLERARARLPIAPDVGEPGHPESASARATHSPVKLPASAFRARASAPVEVYGTETGERVRIPVSIVNESSETWPVGRGPASEGGIALTWHFRRDTEEMLVLEGKRYFLPSDLAPGEKVTIDVMFDAPRDPGRFYIDFDLVQEGHEWFSGTGGCLLRVALLVGVN